MIDSKEAEKKKKISISLDGGKWEYNSDISSKTSLKNTKKTGEKDVQNK